MAPVEHGPGPRSPRREARNRLRDNGLLLACLGLFTVFFVGMIVAGTDAYNGDQLEHGSNDRVSVWGYLDTGDFVEATFENWESEFLQMGMYVVLTAFLYQRGSAESKPIDEQAPQDRDPHDVGADPNTPAPARWHGWALVVYENSLATAFFGLFVASFLLHALGGSRAFNDERVEHGQTAVSFWRFLATSQFWFQSMQELAE